MAASGWRKNAAGTLDFYYAGTKVGAVSAALLAITGATTTTTTVTAGTGLTVTTGDSAVTAGNVRLGAISTFASTEPTSAYVMKQGTAPAGAITTSGGIFSSATVVRKIIAGSTVSNIEA